MTDSKFVGYFRVSTAKQGRSGLGLEAQRAAVTAFLSGGAWTMLAEFTEVESGKRDDRPELMRALDLCRLTGAKLVIAKIDRLSRNAAFLLNLRNAGVKFVAADMPDANELTVGIMAVVAQAERKAISDRTKAALDAARVRGTTRDGRPLVLGGYKGAPPPPSHLGTAGKRQKADAFAAMLRATLTELQASGLSLNAMAAELGRRGILTPQRGDWTATSVRRLLTRIEA